MSSKVRDVIDLEMVKRVIVAKGSFDIRIISSSMHPLIKKDQLIKIYAADEDLKKYDIIVFQRNNKFIAHYIWRLNGVGKISYITRSLECQGFDELPVRKEEIIGVVKDVRISFFNRIIMSIRYGK